MINRRDIRTVFGWMLAFVVVGGAAFAALSLNLPLYIVFLIIAITSVAGGAVIAYFEQEPK